MLFTVPTYAYRSQTKRWKNYTIHARQCKCWLGLQSRDLDQPGRYRCLEYGELVHIILGAVSFSSTIGIFAIHI